MASTLAHGLNYIANQQIKKLIHDLSSDDNTSYTSVVFPIVDTNVNLKKTSPFLNVTTVGNTGVQYSYGTYTDLNKNKGIQKKITKYFLYKILDKWLYNEFRSILAFIKITDGKPSLIRSMNEYNSNSVDTESAENIEKRIDYLEKILINKKLVKHVLKKIMSENNIEWINLNKNKSIIKKIFKKYIREKLESAVNSTKNE